MNKKDMTYTKKRTQRRKIPYLCYIISFLVIISSIWIIWRIYNKNSITINYSVSGVGDKWLATDTAQILSELGYKVQFKHLAKIKPSYNIVLRGNLDNIKKDTTGRKNILWLAWSNLKIRGEEHTMPLDDYVELIIKSSEPYDVIVISSKKLYDIIKNKIKKPVYFIPQFTNTEKFYSDYDKTVASQILFVGNYHFKRKTPLMALEHNYPITIYGNLWPQGVANKKYIDNRILRKYYSSADIILNDTKQNMKDFGFISNRIFDATACKAFIISDYMPEIEDIYGTSIPMYKTEEEFLELLDYYMQNPDERRKKAQEAYNITINKYSNKRIQKMWENLLQDLQ